jgi:hypothetical protein
MCVISHVYSVLAASIPDTATTVDGHIEVPGNQAGHLDMAALLRPLGPQFETPDTDNAIHS